jgi:hypothetical protein
MASGGTPICRPVQARFIGPLGGASDAIGCKGGAFVLLEHSASIASLSHIRAMSIRMDWTLEFGARAAICRHSMACRLHSTGVIMATRQDVRSLAPIPNYTTTIAVFPMDLVRRAGKISKSLSRMPGRRRTLLGGQSYFGGTAALPPCRIYEPRHALLGGVRLARWGLDSIWTYDHGA